METEVKFQKPLKIETFGNFWFFDYIRVDPIFIETFHNDVI